MAIDNSILDIYAGAQGTVPTAGVAGFPQGQVPLTAPQVIPPPQVEQAQQANPLEEVGEHPVFQFYDQWKKSSPEMRKTAEERLRKDFPNPRAMGLPDPTADVESEALARKEGKDVKEDKGAWGKFMKFIDSNPKFLLDLGASLLAPRRAGVSQASAIASGLQSATQRLEQRKAASAKTALETKKTEAELGKIPSEIELNLARAEEARRGKAPGDKTQRTKNYADALRVQFPDLFPDASSALLAAEGQLSGKSKQRAKFLSDFTKDNLIFFDNDPVKAAEAAELAADTLGLARTQSLESMESGQRAAAVKKDPNLLYDYLQKTYPQATHEQIQEKVKQTAGKVATRKAPKAKAVPKAAITRTPTTPVKKEQAVKTAPKAGEDKRQLGAQERRAYMAGIAGKSKEELQEYLAANKTSLSSTQRIKLRRAIKNK